ncbi:MAG: peptidylprolyl isomerase [Salibacteraceae bacterium]
MRKNAFSLSFLVLICLVFTSFSTPDEQDKMVLISTPMGDIKVRLYNETPLHRDNFLKLTKEGFYDGTLFHRVIPQFMVQGGDPDSKGAAPNAILGNGGPGYTLPAELNSRFIHKKGALAAARLSDQQNPEKRSSGSQFYIVQGRTYTPDILQRMVQNRNLQNRQMAFRKFLSKPENANYVERLNRCQANNDQQGMVTLEKEIEPMIEPDLAAGKVNYTQEQIDLYGTLGGTPHLDGAYTVFGEVVEGLEVLDQLAAVTIGSNDRPAEDQAMTVKVLD